VETSRHCRDHRWRRDRSAGSDASVSPRHPSEEPPPMEECPPSEGNPFAATAAFSRNPFDEKAASTTNPFEETAASTANPFDESTGSSSLNPFETSFESEATPRASIVLMDDEGAATERVPAAADGSLSSSSYDNNMADDDNFADSILDQETRSESRKDALAQSSCIVEVEKSLMDKSCDSLTTLQEVLEDYESVMSGNDNLKDHLLSRKCFVALCLDSGLFLQKRYL
jgi:hypothetical protein